MKLNLQESGTLNLIRAYEPHAISVGEQRYEHNQLLMPQHTEPWQVTDFSSLNSAAFAQIAALAPALVIVGTGSTQRFPNPALLQPLLANNIGVEIMDLTAACRTYNVLASEGRHVCAALLFD